MQLVEPKIGMVPRGSRSSDPLLLTTEELHFAVSAHQDVVGHIVNRQPTQMSRFKESKGSLLKGNFRRPFLHER
ncbi:MAG: hypothetical protein C5B58_01730 [Acidobacteria bacterium]|nr:MAG: hypothetical protein C5B58_01730 [Acidobacteriota bacterium]